MSPLSLGRIAPVFPKVILVWSLLLAKKFLVWCILGHATGHGIKCDYWVLSVHTMWHCPCIHLQYALRCTSKHTSLHFKGYFSTKYPLCTAGLSSAHEVLTADALQIYCSDTADGHGRSLFLRNGFWQISPQRNVIASWGFHQWT